MGLNVEQRGSDWVVLDDGGNILAVENSNSAAWRAVERLEVRERGRKSFLYQTDGSLKVRDAD